MNKRLLNTALMQHYRKRAFMFSVVVHVIAAIVFSFFLITAYVQETEDEIQVELISELPRQRTVKKQTIPVPEKEPEPEKEQVPVTAPKRTIQKKESSTPLTKSSVEIAKMSAAAPTQVEIPSESTVDADLPTVLDAPDLSTDADLTPVPESVLSPIGGADVKDTAEKSFGKRKDTGARAPGKGKGTGMTGRIKGRGTGTADDGTGEGTAGGSGNATTGTGDSFSSIIQQLADDIIGSSGGAPVDVVFIVDVSGSMMDNIRGVTEHLVLMIDAYKASEIDYQLGLTQFSMEQQTQSNKISVSQLTNNLTTYKQTLYGILPAADENALDAIQQTVIEMRFRTNTVKHFILLTDEPFTSLQGLTVADAIKLCQKNEIYVNVLGMPLSEHRRLATETGGTWHAIPQDPAAQTQKNMQHPTQKSFREARWEGLQEIGRAVLQDAVNLPTDIIFFIDSSKSMADKMPKLTEQIDLWIRDWDNARIDYRMGVVRFRAKGSVNMVNVFSAPQTQADIHRILALPTQGDENLLSAITEGIRRLKFRPNAKTHLIVVTDEPGDPNYPIAGTIQYLKEIPVVVSVIGTSDKFQQQVTQETGGQWVIIPQGHTRNERYH